MQPSQVSIKHFLGLVLCSVDISYLDFGLHHDTKYLKQGSI